MFLNPDRSKILFVTFNNYNIQDIDELRTFEVDENIKNEIITKLKKHKSQDSEFSSILIEIVNLLPKTCN